jgi:flagellar biosynthetic protein FlhB
VADNGGQERTEEATPKRRRDARRKGTVARSVDLTGSLVLMASLLVLPAAIGSMGSGFLTGMRASLADIPSTLDFSAMGSYCGRSLIPSLPGLAILVFTIMAVGVSANFAQVGFVLSTESLTPSFSKINPFEGFKRLFSSRSVFEAAKATLKAGLFGYLVWSEISAHWPTLMCLSWLTPQGSMSAVGLMLKGICIKVGMCWLVLAGVDYFFQRKQVDKQLKMTKEELKQEMKNAESSPELKAAQHRRRRQLSKGRMMQAVATADVIVTNPTHYAVAISYDREKHAAPVVVAKGADILAAKIREVAKENRVPLVPNPPLARALYKKCEIGDAVPKELFQPVAEVLAYIYRTLKNIR